MNQVESLDLGPGKVEVNRVYDLGVLEGLQKILQTAFDVRLQVEDVGDEVRGLQEEVAEDGIVSGDSLAVADHVQDMLENLNSSFTFLLSIQLAGVHHAVEVVYRGGDQFHQGVVAAYLVVLAVAVIDSLLVISNVRGQLHEALRDSALQINGIWAKAASFQQTVAAVSEPRVVGLRCRPEVWHIVIKT